MFSHDPALIPGSHSMFVTFEEIVRVGCSLESNTEAARRMWVEPGPEPGARSGTLSRTGHS